MEDPNKEQVEETAGTGAASDTGTPPVEPKKPGRKKKEEEQEVEETQTVPELPANACVPCEGTGLIGNPSLPNNRVCSDCAGRGVRG